MKKLVIYHASCVDGFVAALVAKYAMEPKFETEEEIDIEFLSVHYGSDPPAVEGKEVYILDFSYPREILIDMKAKAKSMIVLDHHKTAEEALRGLDFCRFDMDKSGAVMTWEHFFEDEVPLLLKYIQDRDLWKWELPDSREINASLRSHPTDFEVFMKFLVDDERMKDLCAEGIAILRDQRKYVVAKARGYALQKIGGHEVPVINSTHLVSECCHELLLQGDGFPFACCYFDIAQEGKRVYSLRSLPAGADVGEIARRYGGGGHKHSSGFTVSLTPVSLGEESCGSATFGSLEL